MKVDTFSTNRGHPGSNLGGHPFQSMDLPLHRQCLRTVLRRKDAAELPHGGGSGSGSPLHRQLQRKKSKCVKSCSQTHRASSRLSGAYGLAGVPRAGDGVGADEVGAKVELREPATLHLNGDEELVGDPAGARHRR
jgi:hypothetical protein